MATLTTRFPNIMVIGEEVRQASPLPDQWHWAGGHSPCQRKYPLVLPPYSLPYACPILQNIPPTEGDMQSVVTEDAPAVLQEKCPPDLTSVEEKDVSI